MIDFHSLLIGFTVIVCFMVLLGFLNEKTLRLPVEIALMLFSFVVAVAWRVVSSYSAVPSITGVLDSKEYIDLSDYLINGVLCFMLFAGSSRLPFQKLRPSIGMIATFSVFTTLLAALIYSGLFYAVTLLLRLPFSFLDCMIVGCIIAPSDPIAAMTILSKSGLPPKTGLVIEGESLFNDGVGVALFVTFTGMVTSGEVFSLANFGGMLLKELGGGILVGAGVSFFLYFLFVRSADKFRQIFISLLAVALSYLLCEAFGFSGAVASVVCGIFFASRMEKEERKDPKKYESYRGFWEFIDHFLNGALYVLLGLSMLTISSFPYVVVLMVFSVLINLLARYTSVFSTLFLFFRHTPDGFTRGKYAGMLTWSCLRGGLCLALAISTRTVFPPQVYDIVITCTYTVVFFTTIIQGLSVGNVYRFLAKDIQTVAHPPEH